LSLKGKGNCRRTDYPVCEPTSKQQAFLNRHKLQPNRPLDFDEASNTIGQYVSACRRQLPSTRQEQFLKEHGKWRDGMTRGEAFDLIGQIIAGGQI